MLKRVYAIFILFILLFSAAGYYPVFKMEQWKIRQAVRQQIRSSVPINELYEITVTNLQQSGLEWEEQGKEFRHKGQMYDVVRVETVGGTVHYYCLRDKDETALFAHLDSLVKKQLSDEEPLGHAARKILKSWPFFIYILSPGLELPGQKCTGYAKGNAVPAMLLRRGFVRGISIPPWRCV